MMATSRTSDRFGPWLVSPRFDLGAFLVPAVVALALVPLGTWFDGSLPLPMWVVVVLAIDVGHVYSTLFVTYLDPDRRQTLRPWLVAVPLVAVAVGAVAASVSLATFWTALAYIAVFHFVRQQYGWVALYQRKEADLPGWERALDRLTVYAATVYPVLWWHAHLPRNYAWFLPGDFLGGIVSAAWVERAATVYGALLLAFSLVQLDRWARGRRVAVGKVSVVLTTAACWGVGIMATNSDWAFTVTNVILHGVPYSAFVWQQVRLRSSAPASSAAAWSLGSFVSVLLLLAYVEELAWDRLVWHDAAALFPWAEVQLTEGALRWVTVALAVPQLTHYLLDARIW